MDVSNAQVSAEIMRVLVPIAASIDRMEKQLEALETKFQVLGEAVRELIDCIEDCGVIIEDDEECEDDDEPWRESLYDAE